MPFFLSSQACPIVLTIASPIWLVLEAGLLHSFPYQLVVVFEKYLPVGLLILSPLHKLTHSIRFPEKKIIENYHSFAQNTESYTSPFVCVPLRIESHRSAIDILP